MRTVSIIVRRFHCIAAILGVTCVAFGQVQEEWVARYNGSDNLYDAAVAVALDGAGNVYVTGSSASSATGFDYITLKYDANGNQLWERRYNGTADDGDFAHAIAVDSAGNVYVTGEAMSSATFEDYATLKYDTDGTLLWARRYNNDAFNSIDTASALTIDGAGNVYVTGYSYSSPGHRDYLTIKYSTIGDHIWTRRYSGPSDVNDPSAIAVDGSGNVYVTGSSIGLGSEIDYVTIKYDSFGVLQWERRYDGSGNSFDAPYAVAVDGAGSVYVTGMSFGLTMNPDYATLKYDTNGNLLWEKRYEGSGSGSDIAVAVLVDGAGNVLVTGYSEGSGTANDYATLKYDTNGNLLWEIRYNGPGNDNDFARAIAVDSANNVYVTGSSTGSGSGSDSTTLKYDPSGNLLWEMRYNGPDNGTDYASAIAVDDSSSVYVSGASVSAGTSHDYLTIKYSQNTTVLPDSFSLFRGILTGGGLSDLFASDDSWMTVRPGITLDQSERQVQLIINGTAPTETPTELRIRVEAHADIGNIGQWIDLWNYDTSSYEQVDFTIATTSDSIVEVSITVDPGRFIEAGTKQMRTRVSYKEAGIVLSFPWLISFDQTVWVIVP